MAEKTLPPPRLFMILARDAPVAAIFRRGPSKWVRLIQWNTETDRLTYGQWFKGRIYERRCDLSPDGRLLIYFASKFNARTLRDREYTYAWTAISKIPWLTALALWPKGDCWHGGGLFLSNQEVLLNHRPLQANPHPDHQPQNLIVHPNPNARGENDPLYSKRLTRDGWNVVQKWDNVFHGYPKFFETRQPEIRALHHPWKTQHINMTRALSGLGYSESFAVVDEVTGKQVQVEDADFVSWDQQGRLAVLRRGLLEVGHLNYEGQLRLSQIDDFGSQQPERIISPSRAQRW